MSGLEITGAIVCDDVRREDNGKEMLIGVYMTELQVTAFPANVRLHFWIMIRGNKAGHYKFDVRVLGPNDVRYAEGEVGANLVLNDRDGSLNLGPVPVQIQTPGDLRLEVKQPGEDWRETKRLPVVLKPEG